MAPNVPSSKWSSLFTALSYNVGDYAPRSSDTVEIDGVKVPPDEVLQAGTDYWSDYLAVFSLTLAYLIILSMINVIMHGTNKVVSSAFRFFYVHFQILKG